MIAPARKTRAIGFVTVIVIALMLVMSFRLSTLSAVFSGDGQELHAQFSDVAGIAPGDPVRIAGITVGKVDAVHVQRDHALVDLKVKTEVALGERTSASLSLDTLLGQSSVVLSPDGTGQLADGATIPLDRTTTPFTVTDALRATGDELASINTKSLTRAMRTVSAAIDPAAPQVRTAATGVSALSEVIARRESELRTLFRQTRQIAATLASRTDDLVTLIDNSSVVAATLAQRQQVISSLIITTADLTQAIQDVIKDNEGRLTTGLADLHRVLGVLKANQDDLDESLRLLAPYLRYFVNLSGNGRWFDGTFAGLVPDLRGVQ